MPRKLIHNKAYIVVLPIVGALDMEAHLIHWDGRHLAAGIVRGPFFAFADLWLSKPELRSKFGHLKVDAHGYSPEEFMKRHRDVWNRNQTLLTR